MGHRVLIVEADALQRDLMQMALQRGGFEVISTAQSEKVRELILKYRPKLMILDMFMPRINGLDLIKLLRAEGLIAGMTIIALSSMAFREIVHQAAVLGVSEFIIKPFDMDMLLDRVNQVLGKTD
jgi:DNA-binding response OmpR family regulator